MCACVRVGVLCSAADTNIHTHTRAVHVHGYGRRVGKVVWWRTGEGVECVCVGGLVDKTIIYHTISS